MKKALIIILAVVVVAAIVIVCLSTGAPSKNDDFEDAQKNFEDVNASTNKSEIEKTIKSLFGVDISLPSAEEYSADKVELSGVSTYIVLITGSSQDAEQYYNSVKSKFNKWTAIDGSKSFSYEAENVTYGCVISNDGEYLSIAFTATDKELSDALKELVGDTSSFRAKLLELSGVELTFPEIITSVALASSYEIGSKVSYSGMLMSGNNNLDASGFQTVIDALTPQLTGYTKSEPVQGTNSTKVTWTNNEDPKKYFEIVLSDYDGTTWVDFGYNYTDRSLLDPWPAAELEEFLGVASVVPEYGGDYRSLEFSQSEYNPEFCDIELSGADEEEYNAWLAALVEAGFTAEEVEQYYGDPITQYNKQVSEGVFLTVEPRFYGFGAVDVRLTKEVYTNLDWPKEELVAAYGQDVADIIPQIAKATKRSFIFEDGTYYDTLKVENNVSEDLFTEYCEILVNAGFELKQSSSYSKNNTYEYVFDNWDVLKVVVLYTEDSYYESTMLKLEITFTEYAGFGVELPENVEIVYTTTMTIGESSGSSDSRIIKIGESYYMTGVYFFDAYYLFDEETRTWTVYKGTENDDGTVTWSVEEENVTRSNVDKMIGGGFQTLNSKATKTEPEETADYLGVTCAKYTYSVSYGADYNYEYIYWVDESTKLVFDYSCTYSSGSTSIVISSYDTAVTSFGDVTLPE